MVATPLGQGRPRSPDPTSTVVPSPGDHDAISAGAPALADCVGSIDDGLLMVFGPEGDPLPPAAFAAALGADPEARLALVDGTEVPAQRVMAVLQAQTSGRLGPDVPGSDAWLLAMLGLGPQPDGVPEAALQRELDGGQLSAYGNELVIAMPGGGAFLITEAKAARSASETIALFLADGAPIAIGELLKRLRGVNAASEDPYEHPCEPGGREVALPDCLMQVEDDALALELQDLGRVRLARCEDGSSNAPRVAVFFADGRAATMADILAVASPARAAGAASGAIRQASDAGDLGWDAARGEACDASRARRPRTADHARREADVARADTPPRQVISLAASLPRIDELEPEQLALAVVRGVPRGGVLSAGIDNGDGSWLLSPADLDHLTLSLAPDVLRPPSLPLAAIAVTSPDGALTTLSGSLRLTSAPSFGRKPFGRRGTQTAPGHALQLDLTACISGLEGIDAVLIRGVPAGARLSAGTHDAAIAGWVLRPSQLEGLELVPAPDQPPHCTLTILGIALRPGAPRQPRILGQLPVQLI